MFYHFLFDIRSLYFRKKPHFRRTTESFILSRSPTFVSDVYSKTLCTIPFVRIVFTVKTKTIYAKENLFYVSGNNNRKHQKAFAITDVPDDFASKFIDARCKFRFEFTLSYPTDVIRKKSDIKKVIAELNYFADNNERNDIIVNFNINTICFSVFFSDLAKLSIILLISNRLTKLLSTSNNRNG